VEFSRVTPLRKITPVSLCYREKYVSSQSMSCVIESKAFGRLLALCLLMCPCFAMRSHKSSLFVLVHDDSLHVPLCDPVAHDNKLLLPVICIYHDQILLKLRRFGHFI